MQSNHSGGEGCHNQQPLSAIFSRLAESKVTQILTDTPGTIKNRFEYAVPNKMKVDYAKEVKNNFVLSKWEHCWTKCCSCTQFYSVCITLVESDDDYLDLFSPWEGFQVSGRWCTAWASSCHWRGWSQGGSQTPSAPASSTTLCLKPSKKLDLTVNWMRPCRTWGPSRLVPGDFEDRGPRG